MKPPRRKRKVPTGHQPFPVLLSSKREAPEIANSPEPTQSQAGLAYSRQVADDVKPIKPRLVFKGTLTESGAVHINAPGDMTILYKMGFYGKGSLSKHEPIFHSVVEQSRQMIQTHLQQIRDEKYAYRQYSGPLERGHPRKRQLSPKHFVELLSGDISDSDLSVYEEGVDLNTDSCEIDSQNFSNPEIETTLESSVPMQCQIYSKGRKVNSNKTNQLDSSTVLPDFSATQLDFSADQPQFSDTDLNNSPTTWDNSEADRDFWLTETNLPVLPVAVELSQDNPKIPDSPAIFVQPGECMINIDGPDLHQSGGQTGSAVAVCPDIQCPQYNASYEGSDDAEAASSKSSEIYEQTAEVTQPCQTEDKSDYYDMSEVLVLDQCEAVFLMYAFGCILLTDESGNSVTVDDLWRRCIQLEPSFVSKYCAYHYFRSKGWVPKNGLNYGCDFVYKKGPPYFHSSFGVIVRCCEKDSLIEVEQFNPRKLTWHKMMGLNRVISNVKKEMMICYVLVPSHLTDVKLSSPDCIKSFSVCESIMTRMIPTRERDTNESDVGVVR